MVIRVATAEDAPRLAALWRAAGLGVDPDAVPGELAGVQAWTRELVLVEEEQTGELAAGVLGSFDGRRGWVARFAVRPDRQGQGVGSRLLAELETRLDRLGCPKINLLVEAHNAEVTAFYERHGYRRRELLFMEKWLPGSPRGLPGSSRRRALSPELFSARYVFASAAAPPAGVATFAVIHEDDGCTLVLTKADADRAGLGYPYEAARITLRVDSTLDEVGLTASFSKVLAEAGISCNVIAGMAHDHVFVPWSRRTDALALLHQL